MIALSFLFEWRKIVDNDLLGNALFIGARCLYLKAGTQVNIGLVEVVEIKETGVVCKVIKSNATIEPYRGVYWDEGYITKPLAPTNLIVYRG